jgi:nitrous oxidase accessory protein NosD
MIESNECRDDLCAVRVADAADVRVNGNRYETRWFGIHVVGSKAVVIERNQAWRTMRAVNVEGGSATRVVQNLAEHCDTGVVVERDAVGTEVRENWLHDCRVGILCWDDGSSVVAGNAISEPRDHAIVHNRDLELQSNDLGGGDVWTSGSGR